jgi:S1-C subfamily serine protease
MKDNENRYFPEEIEFEDPLEQEDEIYPQKSKRFYLAIVALIILLSFIIWSFPQIGLLFADFSFLTQHQYLKDEEIVQNSLPAIVSIEAKREGNLNNARGTGFNMGTEGFILTNYHVVENSRSLKIEFPDGQVFFSDTYEQIGDADMAVIRLGQNNLPYLSLELQERVEPRDEIIVIGNPLGYKQVSVKGQVESYHQFRDYEILEINAPIRKGSSGSPVLNHNGKATGIVFAYRVYELEDENQYRALAIPLKDFAADIKEVLNN